MSVIIGVEAFNDRFFRLNQDTDSPGPRFTKLLEHGIHVHQVRYIPLHLLIIAVYVYSNIVSY